MRSRVFPSLPTRWPTRLSSRAICSLAATMLLKVSAILPGSPVQEPGRRTEKSPSCMRCRLARMTLRSADGASATSVLWPLLASAVCGAFAGAVAVLELFLFIWICLLKTLQVKACAQVSLHPGGWKLCRTELGSGSNSENQILDNWKAWKWVPGSLLMMGFLDAAFIA